MDFITHLPRLVNASNSEQVEVLCKYEEEAA